MTELLASIDAGDLLQHMPSNVRASLETLERAGTDWNAVGNLLAATPTAGVTITGTGQWASEIWQAVKWEFRSFLCTDSEPYAELRAEWTTLTRQSSAVAVRSLAARIGARIGVASGILAPMVTWLFVVARTMGQEPLCVALSTTRSPYA